MAFIDTHIGINKAVLFIFHVREEWRYKEGEKYQTSYISPATTDKNGRNVSLGTIPICLSGQFWFQNIYLMKKDPIEAGGLVEY